MDANADNEVTDFFIQSYWLSRDLTNDERLNLSGCLEDGDCIGINSTPRKRIKFMQRRSLDSNCNALLAHTC